MIFPKKDEGAPSNPRSFGIWLTMMTTPVPTRNPFNTDPEIRLTRNPSRSSLATTAITPTSTAVRATIPAYCSGLAMASPAMNVATMMAADEAGPT